MRTNSEQKSILAYLEQYLPGIEAGFNKSPQSLLSLKQFDLGWEAFFVTSTYVVASTVLSFVVQMLLSWVATIALLTAIGTVATSLAIQLTDKTATGKKQAENLLDIGMKSTAVFLMITFVPAFLTIGLTLVAGYRSKNLIQNSLPDGLAENLASSGKDTYNYLASSAKGFYNYCAQKCTELSQSDAAGRLEF
jgi:hypothetical protein